ncbi:hypothetical protein [Vibrio sp. S12_S33]|uniref:hypothetical protein n=1 Tax=Vibrio sp. S12_S33 TaxID=2720223 RepID=UPI001EE310B1|nr:hypothetical protein [Vibrio sp. S12_S33]
MKKIFAVMLGVALFGCRDDTTEFSFTPDPEEESPTPTVFETQIGGVTLQGLKEPISPVVSSSVAASSYVSSFSETEQNTNLVTIESFKGIPYAYSGDSSKGAFFWFIAD